MPKFLAVIFLLFITYNLQAQTWEVGGFGGGAGYMGDLNQNNPVKISGVAVGGFVKRNFNGYLSARLGYTYGNISGADSTSSDPQTRSRNLSFKTTLSEVSMVAEFNFMKYIPSVSQNYYTPFIYVGVAYAGYNPQAVYNGQTYNLRPLETEGQTKPYSNTAISIPYGAGIKYNFAGSWNIMADIGYRNPNTDYLDDVKGVYADKTLMKNPIAQALSDRSGERTGLYLGTPGTQRGDFKSRDTYLFIGFSISYTFITQKCYY
jgi:opacity protein-like surface antigen